MGYDAVASAPASIPRDLAKKKRGNRTAKLKQCKLDARREQWLSQVVKDNKDNKSQGMSTGSLTITSSPPNPPRPHKIKSNSSHREEERETKIEPIFLQEMSDSDSNNNRPISSGGSSVGSSSRSISDPDEEQEEQETNPNQEREEENDVLDDWEAVADALTESTSALGETLNLTLANPPVSPTSSDGVSTTKAQPVRGAPRAWRPDDVFRPQSLPSISKQMSFPSSMQRHFGNFDQNGLISLPSSCPICYEDLDSTDSSFLPCSCGFRLCLFCHKRILEADNRCPGCRKQYEKVPEKVVIEINGNKMEPNWSARLSRSCSMNSRY